MTRTGWIVVLVLLLVVWGPLMFLLLVRNMLAGLDGSRSGFDNIEFVCVIAAAVIPVGYAGYSIYTS